MSASDDLFEWIELNDEGLLNETDGRTLCHATHSLNSASGLDLALPVVFSDAEWEMCCSQWLSALKRKSGPRKPAPALCVEAHRSEPIDADRARAATLAMCRSA